MHKAKIGKFEVFYQDQTEFSGLRREIFQEEIYQFSAETQTPRIIDAGAHIGLATLYFKTLYPQTIITCFEPILENFQLLEKNIYQNGLLDVKCEMVALAPKDGQITLHVDPSTSQWFSSASIRPQAWNGTQPTKPVQVKTLSLLPWLDLPVDLLKMDIEGAEWQVLPTIKSHLHQIKQLIIECHPNHDNLLSSLVNLLENQGFQATQSAHHEKLVLLRAKKNT